MKIIVSSAALSKKLSELDLESESVYLIAVDNNTLYIHTPFRFVSMEVTTNNGNAAEMQKNVRWDWIKETISRLQEQPLTIEFTENRAIIYLEF